MPSGARSRIWTRNKGIDMAELREWTGSEIEEYDDARLELAENGKIDCTRAYLKDDVDKVIADLEESHRKEVEQLQMKIAGLEKLVETADKLLKPKGGFTVKDVKFKGIKLEGMASEPEVTENRRD